MPLSPLVRSSRAIFSAFAIGLLATTSANADLPSCPTHNLLHEWKDTKPDVYAKIRTEADSVENGRNVFWKIEKQDTATSYLLGTVHVSDPRVTKLPEAVKSAYQDVNTVVLELSEVVDQQKINAEMAKRPDLMLAKPGHATADLIGSENVPAFKKAVKARGMTLDAVAPLSPVLIYTFLAMPACEFLRQSDGHSFLDKTLGQQALNDGKELRGLETPTEQLEALASLPEDFVKQSLVSSIEFGDKLDVLTSTTVELYLAQDLATIMPLTEAATEEFSGKDQMQEAGYAAFEERLIIQRNHNMADRAVQYLQRGPTLIAVGALHLPGSQGVVELLRAKGYTLSPVNIAR